MDSSTVALILFFTTLIGYAECDFGFFGDFVSPEQDEDVPYEPNYKGGFWHENSLTEKELSHLNKEQQKYGKPFNKVTYVKRTEPQALDDASFLFRLAWMLENERDLNH